MAKVGKRILRRMIVISLLVVLGLYGLLLLYALPRTEVINVTNTEVKRSVGDEGRDVRYVLGAKKDGAAVVFRNEDTGFGFPPYFKFDSGTLDAQASNLAKKSPDTPVLARYYGFRIPMFSLFPNVVSLRVVEENFENFPLFNIVFLSLNIIGFSYLGIKLWLWRRRRKRAAQPV